MSVPSHLKFTFRGKFLGTPEIWSFGVKFRRTQDAGPDAGIDEIDQSAVTSAFSTLLAHGSGATFQQYVKATDWRAYVINEDNRMEGNPLVVDVEASNFIGAGGTIYPPQIALVVTTVADNRGPARFGRFYLPGPGYGISTGYALTDGAAGSYAEAATTFLKSISDAIDIPGSLSSSAAVNISENPGPDGTLQEVDHVEVGLVLDTLRSRRNAMLETRHVHGQIDW